MTKVSQSNLQTLLADLKNHALIRGKDIVLASGQKSDYYVNSKRITLHGERLLNLSHVIFEWLTSHGHSPSHLAGVSVGGDPIVSGVALVAAQKKVPMSVLLVRKEKKAHGATTGKAVEGDDPEHVTSCWLLEDVVSTGGSSLKAAKFLAEEGYRLDGILCLLDREMGGVQHLAAELGIPVHALFRVKEVL
ncbi:MAG TPA: orotate phosphoribosyltransferase [Bdellovibrionota bacterium]|jgi:orotate phosphoribosyltransferase|nr:orotate phosphoribosyltransferase [Bdellovibrionota bacterium]